MARTAKPPIPQAQSTDDATYTKQPKKKTTHKPKAGGSSWPCQINACGKTFAREADLKRHQRTTKSHSTPGFNCPQCSSSFTRTDALRRHQKSRHNGLVVPSPLGATTDKMDEDEESDTGTRSPSPSGSKPKSPAETSAPPQIVQYQTNPSSASGPPPPPWAAEQPQASGSQHLERRTESPPQQQHPQPNLPHMVVFQPIMYGGPAPAPAAAPPGYLGPPPMPNVPPGYFAAQYYEPPPQPNPSLNPQPGGGNGQVIDPSLESEAKEEEKMEVEHKRPAVEVVSPPALSASIPDIGLLMNPEEDFDAEGDPDAEGEEDADGEEDLDEIEHTRYVPLPTSA